MKPRRVLKSIQLSERLTDYASAIWSVNHTLPNSSGSSLLAAVLHCVDSIIETENAT